MVPDLPYRTPVKTFLWPASLAWGGAHWSLMRVLSCSPYPIPYFCWFTLGFPPHADSPSDYTQAVLCASGWSAPLQKANFCSPTWNDFKYHILENLSRSPRSSLVYIGSCCLSGVKSLWPTKSPVAHGLHCFLYIMAINPVIMRSLSGSLVGHRYLA